MNKKKKEKKKNKKKDYWKMNTRKKIKGKNLWKKQKERWRPSIVITESSPWAFQNEADSFNCWEWLLGEDKDDVIKKKERRNINLNMIAENMADNESYKTVAGVPGVAWGEDKRQNVLMI